MSFDKFPLDQQRCMFRVGSYSYDDSKMKFKTKKYGYQSKQSNGIALDYEISKYYVPITLPKKSQHVRTFAVPEHHYFRKCIM